MNVGQARVLVRERSLTETFDLAFRFVIVIGRSVYLRLFFFLVVPALFVIGLSALRGMGWMFVWGLSLVLFVAVELPFTIAASRLLFSEQLTVTETLTTAVRFLPRYMACVVISVVFLALAMLLPILLPFAIARVLYLREIVILEGSKLGPSLQRSQRFTQQRVWSALEASAGLFVLAVSFAIVVHVLASALSSDLFVLDPLTELLRNGGSLFAAAGLLISAPFVATSRFLSYIDGRTRREAWDVQVRFMALAERQRARAA